MDLIQFLEEADPIGEVEVPPVLDVFCMRNPKNNEFTSARGKCVEIVDDVLMKFVN